MNRRDFIKQAAAVAAGAVVGAKLPAAATAISPAFPGIMGVDVARGESKIAILGYSSQLQTVIWKVPHGEELSLHQRDAVDSFAWAISRACGVSPKEFYGLPVEERAELAAYNHIQTNKPTS